MYPWLGAQQKRSPFIKKRREELVNGQTVDEEHVKGSSKQNIFLQSR